LKARNLFLALIGLITITTSAGISHAYEITHSIHADGAVD